MPRRRYANARRPDVAVWHAACLHDRDPTIDAATSLLPALEPVRGTRQPGRGCQRLGLLPMTSADEQAPAPTTSPATVRVLIVADDKERAATLKRMFSKHGHTVHIALRTQERRRLLREHPPGIVIISTARRDASVERALDDITRERSARVILVITTDALARLSIELLRKSDDTYVQTSSIILADDAPRDSVWTWVAALANTLYLEPGPKRRRSRRRPPV
jgi:CheY-like chemotaxis protein